ncbi:hypothetical protein C8R48DRAFT_607172, partial [Suillus tomentosus]
ICPGQHVAYKSVSIGTVLILWAFRLTLDPTQPLDDTWVHEFGEKIPAVLYQIRVEDSRSRAQAQDEELS